MSKLERYPAYKDSGVEWLGKIPEHWEVKKLKYALKFIIGRTPSSGVEDYYNGEEPWVTISDMTGRYIEKSHFISKKAIRECNMQIIPKGSLLYSFKLSVGQVAFTTQNTYTNEAIASFCPANNIDLNFWYYVLPVYVIKNANKNIYGAYLLNQDLIKNATIIFPPKEEQTKIASFLDEKTSQIDKAISQKEKLIELLKEYRQIIINEAVTKGLNKDVEFKDSGVEWIGEIPKHWKILKTKYSHKNLKVLNTKRVCDNILSLTLRGVVNNNIDSPEGLVPKDYATYQIFEKDDLVFKLIDLENISTSRVGIVHEKGIMSSAYIRLKIGKNSIPRFAYYYYYSLYIKQVYNNIGSGVRSTLSPNDLLNIVYIEPPLDEQKQIISFLDEKTAQIDKAIELQQNYITKLKEYKASLIDRVVTGKVKVV